MSDQKLSKAKRDAEDSIAAWLLTLELARARGDADRLAEANRELSRRGVHVHYAENFTGRTGTAALPQAAESEGRAAMTISFFVPGIPCPGGSKRALLHRHTGKIIVKDDAKRNKDWRACVAHAAANAYQGEPLTGPLVLVVEFIMPRPKGHFGSGRNAGIVKPSAPACHINKPDATKLLRALEDALSGVIWRDDAQVVEQIVSKCYGARPGAKVEIYPPLNGLADRRNTGAPARALGDPISAAGEPMEAKA